MPLISVSMTTYNHERYVADAIRSVLAQSHSDFELIIVNDGSTDGTASVVNSFNDPRVVAIHQDNQGPAAATNRALAKARGKYVALFSGDDLCHPDRLAIQLAEYSRGKPRVLFAQNDFVDEFGKTSSSDNFVTTTFGGESLTRAQTLARLFHRGNFLNGVTVFTERCIMGPQPYDAAFLQLQDFDLWVRLVSQYEMHVTPQKLISYRIRAAGGNLSAPNVDADIRASNEHYLILRRFFDGVPLSLFREAFGNVMIHADAQDGVEYECERAFLYARSPVQMARLIGVEYLHRLLNDRTASTILMGKYRFTPVHFFELMRTNDAFRVVSGRVSSLFYDTGNDWTPQQEIRRLVKEGSGEFNLQFKLPPTSGLRDLRWDPVETGPCRVRIHSIEETDGQGKTDFVDLNLLCHNGRALVDGYVQFETNDPSFWWPTPDGITSVVIRGDWELEPALDIIDELQAQVVRLEAALVQARVPQWRKMLRTVKRKLKAS